MIKRLRIKFICITMVIFTVMMTALLAGQINTTRNSLMQINRKAMEDAFREYRLPVLGEKPEDRKPEAEKPGENKLKPGGPEFIKPESEHPCFVLWLDSSGTLMASGSSRYDLSDDTTLLDIYRQAAQRDQSNGILKEYGLEYLRTGSVQQPAYVFTDISGELETMKEMTRNSIVIWGLGFVGFLLLSVFLANWAIRPVEQAWDQQRQFVADASHELKTPLTVILTNAEMLREQARDDRQQQFADSIVTMSRQMRSLVESMLQLARADSGQTDAEREVLDWSQTLETAVLPFEPLYFEQGLILESRIQPGVYVLGNEAQLRQVAEILLDNGRKYSAPGGTVVLALESCGHQCTLSAASPGQPLTQQQCRDIFKRFYRIDRARSRNGSYGLGLAIAERIVSDHRGRIWAESRGGVNTFYVTLPVYCDETKIHPCAKVKNIVKWTPKE